MLRLQFSFDSEDNQAEYYSDSRWDKVEQRKHKAEVHLFVAVSAVNRNIINFTFRVIVKRGETHQSRKYYDANNQSNLLPSEFHTFMGHIG